MVSAMSYIIASFNTLKMGEYAVTVTFPLP